MGLGKLFGREQELSQLRRALTNESLVTLTGPAGCGKTRLARELLEADSNGAVCDLTRAVTEDEVRETLEDAAGWTTAERGSDLDGSLATRDFILLDNA
ncbi:MAG: AAA family ATPase, partial [Myxococcota bacterium]